MMNELVSTEEKRLGVGSLEFVKRHNEIMEANKQLLEDIMLEQEGV